MIWNRKIQQFLNKLRHQIPVHACIHGLHKYEHRLFQSNGMSRDIYGLIYTSSAIWRFFNKYLALYNRKKKCFDIKERPQGGGRWAEVSVHDILASLYSRGLSCFIYILIPFYPHSAFLFSLVQNCSNIRDIYLYIWTCTYEVYCAIWDHYIFFIYRNVFAYLFLLTDSSSTPWKKECSLIFSSSSIKSGLLHRGRA